MLHGSQYPLPVSSVECYRRCGSLKRARGTPLGSSNSPPLPCSTCSSKPPASPPLASKSPAFTSTASHSLSHSQSNLQAAMAGAVGTGPVSTPDDLPGERTNVTTSLLGMGAKALQSLNPIKRIHAHLCAFHFYAHDMSRQVEAHHYCTHYNQDMRQCLIYDSPEKNARLIGVEYIVSEKLFQGLPEDEKKLWHTHEYEVKGGILFMPGVPKVAENKELDEVAKTYGKVFHFWQYDRGDTLPLGLPQLMMSFTEDGQLNPNLASSVEKRFGVSFKENAEGRKHITGPSMGIHPSSNPWLQGIGLKPELREVDFKDN